MAYKPEDEAGKIVERRDNWQKWFRSNLGDELTEVFRGLKCRTKPIYKKDGAGRDTQEEDKSRTNVATGTLNLIWRKNTARMTASPYRLDYIGGSDPSVSLRMSALASQQYDRSDEWWHDRRVTMQTEAFGYGISKLYWDRLAPMRKFRQALLKGQDVIYRDRASILRAQRAPQDEIDASVAQNGPEMSNDEIAQFIGKSGSEIQLQKEVLKYEGPCVKSCFIGDVAFDTDCLRLDDSDYVIEQYRETDLWLKKQLDLTYEDPETGEEVPAFDPEVAKELAEISTEPDYERPNDLKWMFEGAMGRTTGQREMRLRPRKRWDILEQHALDDDGRVWITWVAEKLKSKPLGRMCYPWDLYGKFAYTEQCPLPDLIGPYGDSTPRLLRFLYALQNMTMAQNFDAITNLLYKFVLKREGTNIEQDVVTRGKYRELTVSDINGVKVLEEPGFPAGAFERGTQLERLIGLFEPSYGSTDAGTVTNPQAGRTATTAILASKASDALTQYKLDGRNEYLRQLGQKKLWMNQQQAREEWKIDGKFLPAELRQLVDGTDPLPDWAYSERNGKTVGVRLDPMEIQEDLHVEPQAGSYLAVDDELKRAAAQDLAQTALAAPGVIDLRKVVRFQLSTIRGIGNPDDYILPEVAPQPPPPKVSVAIGLNYKDAEPSVKAALLSEVGIQLDPADVNAATALHSVKEIASASDAAAKLGEPAEPEPLPAPAPKVNGKLRQAQP